MKDKELGNIGESLAVKYLRKQGYGILIKNFRTRIGEIDIIAQKSNMIIFIEVKTRISFQYGCPAEAVGYRKQCKLKKVAEGYLTQKNSWNSPCRFDVIEVIAATDKSYRIHHIKNAFIVSY